MKILLVSATDFEILPALQFLKENFEEKAPFIYEKDELTVRVMITGVGIMHTSFALATVLAGENFDLAINAGIAGAFDAKVPLGKVFQVVADQIADCGIEERDGTFSSCFDMGLTDLNTAPYKDGCLKVDAQEFLPVATAITVNKVHGTAESIQRIRQKYTVDLESMEGAAFLFACEMHDLNALQIRAVSNYIEPRNKDNWKIGLAIDNLNEVLLELVKIFLKD